MNLLNAMTHARLLADNLTAAYYMGVRRSDEPPIDHYLKLGDANDQFVKLAASLGYRLEKIEANPAQPIAA